MKNDSGIQKYQAFLKVVELGSFTKAADSLGYTQANISLMIRDLENEWGIRLLERNRSGLVLTSDGERLLPFAQKIWNDYLKLKVQINEINDIEVGQIRIGTISSIATYYLPEKIKEYKKEHPNIEFEILLGDHDEIESWIDTGRVDFGILKIPTKLKFKEYLLIRDELLLVHNIDSIKKDELVELKDIENYRFILLDRNRCSEILELFEDYNINPKTEFVTWDDYAVMAMVEQGLGISILPKLILTKKPFHIKTNSFKQTCFRELGLVFRDKKYLSKAALLFLIKLIDLA